ARLLGPHQDGVALQGEHQRNRALARRGLELRVHGVARGMRERRAREEHGASEPQSRERPARHQSQSAEVSTPCSVICLMLALKVPAPVTPVAADSKAMPFTFAM